MKLGELAHARAGDKGNTVNIAVFVYRDEDFHLVKERLTAEKVQGHFQEIVTGTVYRYELPELGGLNFVLEGALGGGVTRSTALDSHGKALSSAILSIELEND
ncbi:MAG: AtuA-related protein [Endozoicomonas sp.]